MEMNSKLQIYKGIIQYLKDTSNFDLKIIASLSNSTLKNIQSIHSDNLLPPKFSSERDLVKLYQIILEYQASKEKKYTFSVKDKADENI